MSGYEYTPSGYGAMLNKRRDVSNFTHTFFIQDLVVAPTRNEGYQQQVVRSFISDVKEGDANRVMEDILRSQGVLSNNNQSTNNMVRIGASPVSNANIVDGWTANRYTFKLKVRCTPMVDIPSRVAGYNNDTYDLIITGYSEGSRDFIHMDHTGRAIPDENLLFHVNSVQRVEIDNNRNCIRAIQNLGVTTPMNFQNSPANICVRPQDISSSIGGKSLESTFGNRAYSVPIVSNDVALEFDRSHMVGKQYVNKILNAVVNSAVQPDLNRSSINSMFGDISTSIVSGATTELTTRVINTDVFVQALAQVNFNKEDISFSIQHLKMLDPTFTTDRITYGNVIDDNRFNTDGIIQSIYTSPMDRADKITAKVTELHNIILSILTSNFLSSIKIRIRNVYKPLENGFGMALQPEWYVNKEDIAWTYQPAAANVNAAMLLERSIDGAVKLLIDPMLSESGQLEYDIIIAADVALDTSISISIGGREPILYRFPTFSDMSFTPMVGTYEIKDHLVTNLGVLVNEITSNVIDTPLYDSYGYHNSPMNI